MATFQRFEEIECWQLARELAKDIYAASNKGPFSKDFGLREQIRRSSVSITSDIAEGFERGGTKEFIQFLAIAKGSVAEVSSQLYLALDQVYIDQYTFDLLHTKAIDMRRKIGGLMN